LTVEESDQRTPSSLPGRQLPPPATLTASRSSTSTDARGRRRRRRRVCARNARKLIASGTSDAVDPRRKCRDSGSRRVIIACVPRPGAWLSSRELPPRTAEVLSSPAGSEQTNICSPQLHVVHGLLPVLRWPTIRPQRSTLRLSIKGSALARCLRRRRPGPLIVAEL